MTCQSARQFQNPLPPAVARALTDLAQPAERVASTNIAPAQRLHCSIVRSGNQLLCVILPGDQLLSLQQLSRHTDQDWLPDPQLQQQLSQQLACQRLPALPSLLNMPVLLAGVPEDASVLYVESGLADQLLKLNTAAWLSLTKGCSRANISQPLTLTPQPKDMASLSHLTARRIEQQLGKPLEIPPLPAAARQILLLKNKPDAHADELTAIIETDPALSAQLLSWASSPLYAAGKLHSVEDAIVRVLGFDQVMQLALSLALGKACSLPTGYERWMHRHWQQALRCASLVDGLVRRMPANQRPEAGLAYLCGLLHNFGLLLLGHLFPHYFQLLQQHEHANSHLASWQIEQSLLGLSCSDICATLMLKWHMPEELVTAIAWQHTEQYSGPHASYPRLLRLARQLQQADQALPPSHDSLCQQLQLDPAQAQEELKRLRQAEQALRSFVS